MMSGPAPDCMAAVIRACRSLALMNSNTTSAPSALLASTAWRFSSTSHAGMKSTQRTMLSRVPWAKAGARLAARMPSRPAAAVAPTAADPARNVRRLTAGERVLVLRSGVVIDPSSGPPVGPRRSGLVDLLELALSPLDGVLGLHALDRLGVHVDDDVLRERLGGLAGGRPRVAEDAGISRRGAEQLERLVDLAPHRVLLPRGGGGHAVALAHLEPLLEVLVLVHPAEQILGQLLVFRVLHDRVPVAEVEWVAPLAPGERVDRVVDVQVERLALVVLDLVLLTLGHDVDAGPVQRRRDLARVERAVVVGVVPGQAALVTAFLPQRGHVLDRLDRFLRVDHDLLAARVGLGAAEGPEQGIGPGRRVAEGVAEGLAVGLALLLERGRRLPQLVPGLGEGVEADLLEPGLPVRDRVADDGMGDAQPLASRLERRLVDAVEAALRLGHRLRDVGDVGERVLIELGPVVGHHEEVGAGARLDRGGDAGLQVVGVDRLECHLGAQGLPGFRHLALHLDVGFRDEVVPADEVKLGALGEGRRAPGRQDPLDAANERGGGARRLDERAAVHRRGDGLLRVGAIHGRVLLDRVNCRCRGGVPPRLKLRELSPSGCCPGGEAETSLKAIAEECDWMVRSRAKWWQILNKEPRPCQRETTAQPPIAGLGRAAGIAAGLSVMPRTTAITPIANEPRNSHW